MKELKQYSNTEIVRAYSETKKLFHMGEFDLESINILVDMSEALRYQVGVIHEVMMNDQKAFAKMGVILMMSTNPILCSNTRFVECIENGCEDINMHIFCNASAEQVIEAYETHEELYADSLKAMKYMASKYDELIGMYNVPNQDNLMEEAAVLYYCIYEEAPKDTNPESSTDQLMKQMEETNRKYEESRERVMKAHEKMVKNMSETQTRFEQMRREMDESNRQYEENRKETERLLNELDPPVKERKVKGWFGRKK